MNGSKYTARLYSSQRKSARVFRFLFAGRPRSVFCVKVCFIVICEFFWALFEGKVCAGEGRVGSVRLTELVQVAYVHLVTFRQDTTAPLRTRPSFFDR